MTSSSFLVKDPNNQLHLKQHPDNLQLDSDTGYGIDQIRELTAWILKKPFNRRYKLVHIRQAENLSTQAQNALLKTIEEPPNHSYIFLSVQNTEQILETIKSRCTTISATNLLDDTLPNEEKIIWSEEFISDEKKDETHQFPHPSSEKEAFELAKKLSKKDRGEIQKLLERWATDLTEEDPDTYYQTIDHILQAKEHVAANTNVQLTLEVMFLEIVTDLKR